MDRARNESRHVIRRGIKTEFTPEFNEQLRFYLAMPAEHPQKMKRRDDLVKKIMPYVEKIARGLARRSSDPVDDIIQVGSIGLMKALDKFNIHAGTSFKTYATYLITGEIRHYLRDKSGMIKAPRQIYELHYRMNLIIQQLSEEYGRVPTDEEIASRLECPIEKVNQAQEVDRRRQMVSLDNVTSCEATGSESNMLEKLVDEKYFEIVQNNENRMVLENAMGALKEDLRVVIELTYYEDLSQTEIASQLGISQMQVSRRLRKGLDLLGSRLKEPRAASY